MPVEKPRARQMAVAPRAFASAALTPVTLPCLLQSMMQDEDIGLPVRAALHSTGLYVALRQIEREELRDAFMQETIARLPTTERIMHVASDQVGRAAHGTAPVGIIFHVSRCGSTLVSQSLKQLENLVVYAEPQPINELLAPPHRWPRANLAAALRTLGAAFARHAGGPYVLKLSSWNTFYCDIVAEAFPDAPWVLCVRDPVEVGVSLLASPPGWFQQTSDAARALAAQVNALGPSASREEFVARIFAQFCAAAADLDTRCGRLVMYESLPEAVWDIIAPHFSLSIDPPLRERIVATSRRHAKAPIGSAAEFTSDVAAKQKAASLELRSAIDSLARPQLERLMRLHADTMHR